MFCYSAAAQKFIMPNEVLMNRIYVQYNDSIVETYYYKGDKEIKAKEDVVYYWYAARDIKHTRGGYEGKILHGKYTMFYANKDLHTKGTFNYGVKIGKWEYWYAGGEIKCREQWKNGLLDGIVIKYTNRGLVSTKKTYRKGKLNGWSYYYDEKKGLTEKEYFEEGVSAKKEFFTLNDKGKLVKVSDNPDKKNKEEKTPKANKKKQENTPVENKKPKKNKKAKIKIQRYNELQPGGQGI